MNSEKRILLFGGTFNPIHNGHLIVSRSMAEQIGADKVCIIPNGIPPHKDSVLSLPHKMMMLKYAIENDSFFELNTYEIDKKTPSYTLETVRFMRMCLGETPTINWMIGPDNLLDLVNWYKIEELVKECIFVVGSKTPSHETFAEMKTWSFFDDLQLVIAPIPHLDIRSTTIRKRIQAGLPISHYVPDTVEKYIQKHGLYIDNQ